VPMPRKADPKKDCVTCGRPLERKRFPSRLEDRTRFLTRVLTFWQDLHDANNARIEQLEVENVSMREALERIAALGRDEDGAEVPGDFLTHARDIALASLSPPTEDDPR